MTPQETAGISCTAGDHDKPQPGDRVRASYEATLDALMPDGRWIVSVSVGGEVPWYCNVLPAGAEIKVIGRAGDGA